MVVQVLVRRKLQKFGFEVMIVLIYMNEDMEKVGLFIYKRRIGRYYGCLKKREKVKNRFLN